MAHTAPPIGKLNLAALGGEHAAPGNNSVKKLNLALLSGDQEVKGPEQLRATPRADNQQVLVTPRNRVLSAGDARHRFEAGPQHHGEGPVLVAAAGRLVASIGASMVLHVWQASGQLLGSLPLLAEGHAHHPPPSAKSDPLRSGKSDASSRSGKAERHRYPSWLQFDCQGSVLGVLLPGEGLWLVQTPTAPGQLRAELIDSGESTWKLSWAAFCSTHPQLLAVGTEGGRVSLYSKTSKKLVAQAAGKHPGREHRISCGEWLGNGMLALASRERLKVSKPIFPEAAEWQTFSKFYLGKMISKIPTKQVHNEKTAYDAAPIIVTVSGGEHKIIAMALGDKVVTIVDYTGSFPEEGFFIPLDYGGIVTMTWLPNHRLLVGLANGYVVSVNTMLLLQQRGNASVSGEAQAAPTGAMAMRTTRVFSSYLSQAAPLAGHAAIVGDSCLKVVQVDPSPGQGFTDLLVLMEMPFAGFVPRPGVALTHLSCCAMSGGGGGGGLGGMDTERSTGVAALFENCVLNDNDAREQEWHVVASAADGRLYSLNVSRQMLSADNLLSI